MRYRVEITEPAEDMLNELKSQGKDTLYQLREVILGLDTDPEGQSEPLRGFLAGYRSLHCGRFRVVLRISHRRVIVYVVGVGIHKSGDRHDVYEIVAHAIKLNRFSNVLFR